MGYAVSESPNIEVGVNFRKIFKVSRKTFFNPAEWVGIDTLVWQNNFIVKIVKSALGITQSKDASPEQTKTFQEKRLEAGLTEDDLKLASQRFYRYSIVFLVLACIALCYFFYQIFLLHSLPGAMLSLSVSALLFVNAIRYSFRCCQIEQKKFNISWSLWWILMKKKLLGQ